MATNRMLGLIVVLGALTVSAPARAAPFAVQKAKFRERVRFAVAYAGSGSYATVFHATPPNPGGKADTNDAHDSSTQAWKLRFRRQLEIPACDSTDSDPCSSVGSLSGALGVWTITGRIRHKHVDGLFDGLDATARCDLKQTARSERSPPATLAVSYAAGVFELAATDPIAGPLNLFPQSCREPVDGIDRILANYFTPGFSFAPGYGPERWFGSATVRIPAAVLHRAARVTIPLATKRTARPPKDCAVANPEYERCRTGGRWSGVLTLTAVG